MAALNPHSVVSPHFLECRCPYAPARLNVIAKMDEPLGERVYVQIWNGQPRLVVHELFGTAGFLEANDR